MGSGSPHAARARSKEVQGLGAEVLVALYEDSVAAEDRSAAYVKIIERCGQAHKRCPRD